MITMDNALIWAISGGGRLRLFSPEEEALIAAAAAEREEGERA